MLSPSSTNMKGSGKVVAAMTGMAMLAAMRATSSNTGFVAPTSLRGSQGVGAAVGASAESSNRIASGAGSAATVATVGAAAALLAGGLRSGAKQSRSRACRVVVKAGKALSELSVGDVVDGTVMRAAPFGLFVDIGAERDALWPASQLSKPIEEYKKGDKVTGLKIIQCDVEKQRISVSDLKSAADFAEGEEIKGTVSKIMAFGVFVNIGASTDALAPARMLAKEPNEYTVGEELELKIANVEVATNRITLTQGGKPGRGDSAGRITMEELSIGDKVKGTVRQAKDYGVFVDIGLGRTDALLPGGLMGDDRTPESFKPNDEVEVYIANLDQERGRVTLSVNEPAPDARGSVVKGGSGKLPSDDCYPDAKLWAVKQGSSEPGEEDSIVDDEGIPWKEWETKYPGLIKFPKKEVELYMCVKGYGFSGVDEAAQSEPNYIPIPVHLRKPDAGTPEIPEYSFDDYEMGYEYGIKPEIHTKFRQPPFNDPNWTHKPEKKVMKKAKA